MELAVATLLWVSGTSWCLYKWIGRAYTVCEAPKASAYGFGVVLDLVGSHIGSDAAVMAQAACVPFQLTFGTLGWLYDQIPTVNTNTTNSSFPLVATTPATRSPQALSTYLHKVQWYTINDCVKLMEKQWETMSAKLDWVVQQAPPEVVTAVKQYIWVVFIALAGLAALWRYRQLSHVRHALSLLLTGVAFVTQKWYTNSRITAHDLSTLLLLLVLVDKMFTLLSSGGRDALQARIDAVEGKVHTMEQHIDDLQLVIKHLRTDLQAATARAELTYPPWPYTTQYPLESPNEREQEAVKRPAIPSSAPLWLPGPHEDPPYGNTAVKEELLCATTPPATASPTRPKSTPMR